MAISGSVTRGFTFATGVEVTAANLNLLGTPSVSVATPISVGNGGTNATTAANARTNLGLGSIATQASNSIAVTGGTMSGVLTTLPSYAVSALPSAGTAGRLVFCTDGDGGNKCLAVDDGTAWKRIALGATVST
tara:strand:- start:6131 stop:6532 length:402 start_codon:yes stop_codon:yes gene_type:complete